MLNKNVENIFTPYFEKEIPQPDFSNARLVRNIFEKSKLMIGLSEAYVYDFSHYGSEFGDIKIADANGGLARIL